MKVTIEYDLSIPEEDFAYKCSQKAVEACLTLESLKAYTQGYKAYSMTSETVLADIINDLSKWENVK